MLRFLKVLGLSLTPTVALLGFCLHALAAEPAAQTDLRINEFMADNRFTLEDPDEPGEHPDWIELYNPSSSAVSLNNLFWTDDPTEPTRFPITNGLTIPAKGFLIFYADNDSRQGAHHLSFALSRDEGFIGLYSGSTDALIDFHEYGPQTTDISSGRATDGGATWRTFTQATPGRTNILRSPAITNLQQTPVQPTAGTPVTITAVITDERGLTSIALHYAISNSAPVTVPLTALPNNRVTAVIPAQPDGTIVHYYLSARDIDNLTSFAPLGYPAITYAYKVGFQTPLLYVNEVMAENSSSFVNPDKAEDYPDWIEIYNPSPNAVSLDGLYLTDAFDDPTKFPIPAGLSIAAGGHLVFIADDDTGLGKNHTNFKLSKGGEFVGIYGAEGAVQIDGYEFGEQDENFSMARTPDGGTQWRKIACITPGASNSACEPKSFLPSIFRR